MRIAAQCDFVYKLLMTTYYYLYHLRDPANSAGFGFDGYLGITDNPHRREAEHMRALKAGKHQNLRLKEDFDKANGLLENENCEARHQGRSPGLRGAAS